MNGLPTGTNIYLCTQPVDFRKGFDGLTGVVTTALGHNVTDGSLFLFVNRKQDRIKALWWETGGLTLWYRRLEQGTVEPPKADDDQSHDRFGRVGDVDRRCAAEVGAAKKKTNEGRLNQESLLLKSNTLRPRCVQQVSWMRSLLQTNSHFPMTSKPVIG